MLRRGSAAFEGELTDTIEEIVIRCFAVGSSIATGLAVGAISGLIAAGLARLMR
jgi:hypothetical protein